MAGSVRITSFVADPFSDARRGISFSVMDQLTITQQFRPPGIIAHTNESIAKIPTGTYQVAGHCQTGYGAVMVALMRDDVTYLVEKTFLDWIRDQLPAC